MAHFSTLLKMVIDVPPADHDRELAFWRGALGQELPQFPPPQSEYHGAELHGHDLWLLVQRLGDGQPRVHLDMHTDDLDAEVARLEALGARRVRQVHAWWVMRDPAGLPFCVLPEPPGSLNEDNAQRWDLGQVARGIWPELRARRWLPPRTRFPSRGGGHGRPPAVLSCAGCRGLAPELAGG